MSWLALELEIDGDAAEPLSEALLELGADSVTIEDAAAGLPPEPPPVDEGLSGWARNRIRAIVPLETDPARFVRCAAEAAGLPNAPVFQIHTVEAEDWVRRTQSQFGPLQVGDRLWIVPSWAEAPAAAQTVVLRLDPGLAFGTGSHPTTRLVLAWLDGQYLGRMPRSLLDYGCGSGILALAAAKLGAADVVATDTDPQALRTCAENAARNDVAVAVLPPEQIATRTFELIVANILARPLIELAPTLKRFATRGTRLALCGILEGQADDVICAYAPSFDLSVTRSDEGWVLVAGTRR